jgi:hypothetical protein
MAIIMKFTAFLLGLCLAAASFAADPDVSGPFAGFVLDAQSRAVRPVIGVPGAAYLGSDILQNVEALAVSPEGTSALAALGESLAMVRRLPSGEFDTANIERGLAAADRLAWSSDGKTAVAFSSKAGVAQVLRNGAVQRSFEIALEGVAAVAVDNSGGHVLLGSQAGLYLAAGGDITLIASLTPSAIALAGPDAFVAAGGVFEIKDYAGKATLLTFADGAAAAGLEVSRDGKRLLVAEAQSVAVYDIASRTATARVDLDFAPSRLAQLGAPATFVLNSGTAGSEPLYVVDASAAPAVYFVPAGREQ